jgi:peptidoglycan/xylan/chitin deacetylase (PgdA/CDA1 family)
MTEHTFTFDWYDELLARLQENDYTFANFKEQIEEQTVLLRHDVDWSPRKAVRLAEIEAKKDVTATYFFLVSSPFYNVMNSEVRNQISRITELGHEIGLHFSTHQYFDTEPHDRDGEKPADSELLTVIKKERDVLKRTIDDSIEVISFHNPPEWVFNESFPEFVSTYEKRFFEEIVYQADSNQRWRKKQPFGKRLPEKMQILTHPVLWGENDGDSIDRLREERDYNVTRINKHLQKTDRIWDSHYEQRWSQ